MESTRYSDFINKNILLSYRVEKVNFQSEKLENHL